MEKCKKNKQRSLPDSSEIVTVPPASLFSTFFYIPKHTTTIHLGCVTDKQLQPFLPFNNTNHFTNPRCPLSLRWADATSFLPLTYGEVEHVVRCNEWKRKGQLIRQENLAPNLAWKANTVRQKKEKDFVDRNSRSRVKWSLLPKHLNYFVITRAMRVKRHWSAQAKHRQPFAYGFLLFYAFSQRERVLHHFQLNRQTHPASKPTLSSQKRCVGEGLIIAITAVGAERHNLR